MSDIAQRVQRLEDIEAIRRLKAEYCAVCDDGHDPDRIARLFTPDGIWESPTIGRFTGTAEIRLEFSRAGQRITRSQHSVLNEMIDVDGDRATGVWYLIALFERPAEPNPTWSLGRYYDEYARVDGQWLIKHLRVQPLGRLDAGPFLNPTAPRPDYDLGAAG